MLKKLLLTICFIFLFICLLLFPQGGLSFAKNGLMLWFEKMIPALLPFMILSGMAVKLELTETISAIFCSILQPAFRVRKNVLYCTCIGFLCGFPMGAKVTAELYSQHKLHKKEAEFLLAFCNNLGPIYYISFVVPTLELSTVMPFLIGMYGIPFCYAILLRYTYFHKALNSLYQADNALKLSKYKSKEKRNNILQYLEETIVSAMNSIASLGGYMIFFNILLLPFSLVLSHCYQYIAPLVEISGGLTILGKKCIIYSLCMLNFGGLCCIAQTYSCLKNTDLSITFYVRHRIIITVLAFIYYSFIM